MKSMEKISRKEEKTKSHPETAEWWYPNLYWAIDETNKEHLIVEIECCSGTVNMEVKRVKELVYDRDLLENAQADDIVCIFEYFEDHHGNPSIFRRVFPEIVKAAAGTGNYFHLLARYSYNKSGTDKVGGKKRTRRSGTLVLNAKN